MQKHVPKDVSFFLSKIDARSVPHTANQLLDLAPRIDRDIQPTGHDLPMSSTHAMRRQYIFLPLYMRTLRS